MSYQDRQYLQCPFMKNVHPEMQFFPLFVSVLLSRKILLLKYQLQLAYYWTYNCYLFLMVACVGNGFHKFRHNYGVWMGEFPEYTLRSCCWSWVSNFRWNSVSMHLSVFFVLLHLIHCLTSNCLNPLLGIWRVRIVGWTLPTSGYTMKF